MRSAKKKIIPPSRLKRFFSKKRNVVFTNGCFDILHKGHVEYLERARKLGASLVVALNTDASVKKLKGPTRPVNSLNDRVAVISALESVDYVTWFGEPTPLKIIETIRPKVLVKGGDWKPRQIVGYDEVKGWGGRVKSLPFVRGKSTTNIIEKSKTRQ